MKASADRVFNLFGPRYWLGQLDLRPLGLMRIAFGAATLAAVADLSSSLFDFFSDHGVAPRIALLGSMVRFNRVSVYDIAGPDWLLVVLFLLTLTATACLTIGWHSRVASVASFVLVCGLHERNLMIFDGSDNVLRVMLFWLMFMPSGGRYSVDAVLRAARGQPPISHGTALPIRLGQVQVAWIYLNTVLHKWPGMEWHNGTALRIALGLDHLFTRPLGRFLFDQPWFTSFGTYFTVAVEVAFLPLVFLPLGRPQRGWPARLPAWLFQPTYKAVALAAGAAMHLGIALTMSVGNFTPIMLASYLLFFEPAWAAAAVRTLNLNWLWGTGQTAVLYDGECRLCTRLAEALRGLDVYGRLLLIDFAARGQPRGALAGVPGNLSKAALAARLHAVEPGGGVVSGFAAWTRIARRLPLLAPLGYLGALAGPAGEPLYDKVAAYRQLLESRPAATDPLHARFWAAIPEGLSSALRVALRLTLVALLFLSMWFSLPDVAKIPPLTVFGKPYTPAFDVSPARMWPPLHNAVEELELWQKWDMFSPKPLDHDVYLMGHGQLADGTQVDVVRGDRGDRGGAILPPIVPGLFFNRWTKYVNNIVYEPERSAWTLEFGRFICRRWNVSPPRGRALLKNFQLYREERKVPLFGETAEAWQEKLIWDHHCFD